MDISIEAIVFYIVLLDAATAFLIAWSGRGKDMNVKLGVVGRFFPITRGWTTYYLILVLWIGSLMLRHGML